MKHVLLPQSLNATKHLSQNFKALLKAMFDANCETVFYTLKFRILDRFVEHVHRFECLELLSSSAYEHFNVYMKQAYRSASQCLTSALEENLSAVDMNICNER